MRWARWRSAWMLGAPWLGASAEDSVLQPRTAGIDGGALSTQPELGPQVRATTSYHQRIAPGLMEALNPVRVESRGSTEEVQR